MENEQKGTPKGGSVHFMCIFLICLQSNNNLKLYQINISKYSFFAIFSKGLCITHCPFLIRTLNTRISYQFGFRHYLSSHAPTFSLKKKV